MKNFLYILLSMCLISCETLIEDLPLSRFPELKSKMVLTSFISPQDNMITVKVSQSIPLFGKYPLPKPEKMIDFKGDTILVVNYSNENIINNAVVTISNGQTTKQLKYNINSREYEIPFTEFNIKAGETYFLKAKTADLQAEAETKVPFENIKIENIKIDSTIESSNTWVPDSLGHFKPLTEKIKVYYCEFDWKDIANTENYYKIDGFKLQIMEAVWLENNIIVKKQVNAGFPINWGGKNYDNKKRYVTDNDKDGKTIISPRGRIENINFNGGGTSINGKFYPYKLISKHPTFELKLYNLNKDYYENQLSLGKIGDSGSGDNPFTEAVQVYSNIKNGLGCFGASNSSVKIIELK